MHRLAPLSPVSLTGGPPRSLGRHLPPAPALACASPFPGAVELRLEPSPCVIVHRGVTHLMRVTSPPPEPSLTAPPLAWLAHACPLTVSHRGDVSELHRPSPPIKGLQNPPWLCFDFPLGLASTHSPSLALRAEPLLPPLLKLRCSRCRRISGDSLSSPVGSVEAPHSREPFA